MKHQAYFLRKIKVKKLKCRLLQFLFSSVRVNAILFELAPSIQRLLLKWDGSASGRAVVLPPAPASALAAAALAKC